MSKPAHNSGHQLRGALHTTVVLLFALLGFVTGNLAAQQSSRGTEEQHRKTSTPYTGDLSIFDSPGREQRLQIDRVMDMLGIAPGKNVADIGAGSGWFTVRAARRVTDAGTVYAVDINPKAVEYIQQRAGREKLNNIKTILGRSDNSLLPANSVDSVLLLKTYHEVAHPVELLWNLRQSLKPGARVGITAGASAPEILVEEVVAACRERYEVSIEEVVVTEETVTFNLPRALSA